MSGREALSVDDIAALPGSIEDVASVSEGAVGAAVPATALMEVAQPDDDVAFCSVISADGSYSASIPLADLIAGGWLAFRIGDEPLPSSAGGPLRLTVAKGRTLCWNVKDVAELRFTTTRHPDIVPARPKH